MIKRIFATQKLYPKDLRANFLKAIPTINCIIYSSKIMDEDISLGIKVAYKNIA